MKLALGALGLLFACTLDERVVRVGADAALGGTGGSDTRGSDVVAMGGTLGMGPNEAPGGTGGGSGSGPETVDASAGQGGSSGAANVCDPNAGMGAECDGGTCADEPCMVGAACAVDVVNAVPFTTSWSSVGQPNLYNGGCDSLGTPDYALVFLAPQSGTFRITSVARVDAVPYSGPGDPSGVPTGPADGDAVMTIVRGDCTGPSAQQLACNDDVAPGNINSQLDLALAADAVVTVYLNELTQTGGGTGTVTVELLP